MSVETDLYSLLSKVMDYPTNSYFEKLDESIRLAGTDYLDAAEKLEELKKNISTFSIDKLEEVYTRTFDVQGACTLDVGNILFGEDYKRGQFLVNIQALQKEYQVSTGVELSDHLTNFLKLLSVVDNDIKKDLIEKILMPAITKMLENFTEEINEYNFYSLGLKAVQATLEKNYKIDRTIFGDRVC